MKFGVDNFCNKNESDVIEAYVRFATRKKDNCIIANFVCGCQSTKNGSHVKQKPLKGAVVAERSSELILIA